MCALISSDKLNSTRTAQVHLKCIGATRTTNGSTKFRAKLHSLAESFVLGRVAVCLR